MTIPLIAIEIVVGFAVPLGFAIWQLVSVRRELQRDREKAAREAAAQQAAPGADPPAG
ncbi:MAG: hypothetical protein V4562_04645 [Pseudomonadota bacterium]